MVLPDRAITGINSKTIISFQISTRARMKTIHTPHGATYNKWCDHVEVCQLGVIVGDIANDNHQRGPWRNVS
jgi:hypothetical protein